MPPVGDLLPLGGWRWLRFFSLPVRPERLGSTYPGTAGLMPAAPVPAPGALADRKQACFRNGTSHCESERYLITMFQVRS
jgi:hypothetical protein